MIHQFIFQSKEGRGAMHDEGQIALQKGEFGEGPQPRFRTLSVCIPLTFH